jgi:hypothetical protein
MKQLATTPSFKEHEEKALKKEEKKMYKLVNMGQQPLPPPPTCPHQGGVDH